MLSAPLFLVGAERSGTTLLRLMLNGHPQLAWNEEFEYAVDLLPQTDGFPLLEEYHRFLETDRVFLASAFQIDRRLSYPELINSFLVQKRGNKPLVGATVHRHFDLLLRIWPDARFIHLLRDGRDVARSVVEMGWAGNTYHAAERWIEAEYLWENLSSKLPADRQLSLKFEGLIEDPVGELTRICRFCGVDYDSAMMDYPKYSTYGLPDRKIVSSWKRKMSQEEVQLVEARVGPMLEARGYDSSGYPPLDITPAFERRLARQNRWGIRRFRLRRFGLRLLLKDFLSRKLHLASLQKQARLEIHAIENKYLK